MITSQALPFDLFEECRKVNSLIEAGNDSEARDELIKLLDLHKKNEVEYTPLVNHLIRRTGLYPYIDDETSSWQEKYIHEVFKVNTGDLEDLTMHREQSLLLSKLIEGKNIAVSAPTSFGKSFVIDAYISIRKPNNIMIIVPTIALTDETRRRLYKKFAGEYKIITTTDVVLAEKNIFIFPQERAIQYLDALTEIDMLIVDEFYKASADFDSERSPTLVKSILKLGKIAKQKYFLAPNISKLSDNPFTEDMEFLPLDFNTVFLEKHELYKEIKKDDSLKSKFLLDILKDKKAKSLIYAGTYSNITAISNILLAELPKSENSYLKDFAEWLSEHYSANWNLTKLVSKGTGIHNGQLHRSLSQIQVRLFEEENGGIDNIISTSSIIEGVNTSAENVILWMNKNGNSKLNDFTYKNIIGRGGRMFRHFVGNIFILDQPPVQENTQLDIAFPDEILGDVDPEKYKNVLTKEQISKIILYENEMKEILGEDVFSRLQSENLFRASNMKTVRAIAHDMKENPQEWNGLNYLNSSDTSTWDRFLYKIIRLEPGGWDPGYKKVVEFTKVLRKNWFLPIPELLRRLEPFDIGLDDFFKLERKVTFKLSALLNDVNTLQKEILSHKGYDISGFIHYCSHAFLPPVVYDLEEFGLPRMLARKIHKARVINFYDEELTIHGVIDRFIEIGIDNILSIGWSEFEVYIISYFFDGISTNSN